MQEKLNNLHRRMCCTRVLLYFLRNNPVYTYRYYYSFIEIVGPEMYLRSTCIRNEWDSARYSFDKMYGLISAWCKKFDMLDEDSTVFEDIRKSFSNFVFSEVNQINTCFSVTENEVFDILRAYNEIDAKRIFAGFLKIRDDISTVNEKSDKNNSEYKQLTADIEKLKKITEIYRQIIKLSDSVKD